MARTWTLAVVLAVLGGAVGLALSLARDTYCIDGGDPGFDAVFVCPYKGLFGWDAVPLVADAVWTAVGVLVGGFPGTSPFA